MMLQFRPVGRLFGHLFSFGHQQRSFQSVQKLLQHRVCDTDADHHSNAQSIAGAPWANNGDNPAQTIGGLGSVKPTTCVEGQKPSGADENTSTSRTAGETLQLFIKTAYKTSFKSKHVERAYARLSRDIPAAAQAIAGLKPKSQRRSIEILCDLCNDVKTWPTLQVALEMFTSGSWYDVLGGLHTSRVVKDIQYYHLTTPLPFHEFPSDYWVDLEPDHFVRYVARYVVTNATIHSELSSIYRDMDTTQECKETSMLHQCRTTMEVGDRTYRGFGEGQSASKAEQAASLDVISQIYCSGQLRRWFYPETPSSNLDYDGELLLRRPGCIVYDCAAYLGLTPRFEHSIIKTLQSGQEISLYRVSIKLDELSLERTAVSERGWAFAETLAASSINQVLMERARTPNFLLSSRKKRNITLNTQNAKDFILHYLYSKEIPSLGTHGGWSRLFPGLKSGATVINGQTVGEKVWLYSDRKDVEACAYLTAATEITNYDPEFLQELPNTYLDLNSVFKENKFKYLKSRESTFLDDKDYPVSYDGQSHGRKQEETHDGNVDGASSVKAGATTTASDTCPRLTQVGLNVDCSSLQLMQKPLPHSKCTGPSWKAGASQKVYQDTVRSQTIRLSPLSEKAQLDRNLQLMSYQLNLYTNPMRQSLRVRKESLPISRYAERLVDIISKHQVSFVKAPTGSGKTTQVPQIILENAITEGKGSSCNVICVQPQPALHVPVIARRVAFERGEELGQTVGYYVRDDDRRPQYGGSISYYSAMVLLEQLRDDPASIFDTASHIIIDGNDIYGRDTFTDLLLIVLKNTLHKRCDQGMNLPKIIVMGEIFNTDTFTKYFYGEANKPNACGILDIPSQPAPVTETYLDKTLAQLRRSYGSQFDALLFHDKGFKKLMELDFAASHLKGPAEIRIAAESQVQLQGWQSFDEGCVSASLVAATIAHICITTRNGAILVWLPRSAPIPKILGILRRREGVFGTNFINKSKFQFDVFDSSQMRTPEGMKAPPVQPGCRRIILMTKPAKQSMVHDAKHIVDCGLKWQSQYDERISTNRLQTVWISKSAARQRVCCIGNIQNGSYYGLFSEERHRLMRDYELPEVLRVDLQHTCLLVKAQGMKGKIRELLAAAIEPPAPEAVNDTIGHLVAIEALTADEELTALGSILATLSFSPAEGKLVLLGIIFKCLDPILTMCAATRETKFFRYPLGQVGSADTVRVSYARGHDSDQLAVLEAFNDLWRLNDGSEMGNLAIHDQAARRYLHDDVFFRMMKTKTSIYQDLEKAGLVPLSDDVSGLTIGGPSLNRNSNSEALIKALLLASLNSRLAFNVPLWKNSLRIRGSPSLVEMDRDSVNYPSSKFPKGTLFVYRRLVRSVTSDITTVESTTKIDALAAVLFGGSVESEGGTQNIRKDGWLQFNVKKNDSPGGPAPTGQSRESSDATKTILDFKARLDEMIQDAYQSLARASDTESLDRPVGLPEDPAREALVERVVELLSSRQV
ncbi:hypothetical protein BKA67DRAFT_574629 [Truncatella angustata]|uniref:Helicase-associated domain-containing protein n=1 Tax=Truncatella angustata TaxID=152316 RepID=A0A9P8UED0_9PEZI|nr:uncharacterized protein BKA67DRAFT_574629 [Truncatella angustata]KAH6648374.1 hypothetical protein BKA67DRAFT_574629 [Truncatella angustata]KAH8204812.1 hypothetical protein TruAng_001001 [Truncatella angustata]